MCARLQLTALSSTALTSGIYEWEAALNISTGKVYYVNNVNYTNVSKAAEYVEPEPRSQ